jgi:hypothetical protein
MTRQGELSAKLLQVARSQEWLVTANQLADDGISRMSITRRVTQGKLIRVARGVYDTVPIPPQNRTRVWAAKVGWDPPSLVHDHLRRRAAILALLGHGPTAVADGLGALALRSVRGLPAMFVGEVVMPHRGPRSHNAARVRRIRQEVADSLVSGFRVSPLVPSVATALLSLASVPTGERYAAAMVNDLLHDREIDREQLARVRDLLARRRGACLVRSWWRFFDGRIESPAESHALVSFIERDIPPDAIQLVVKDSNGRFLGRFDFAWKTSRGEVVLVEIDGAEYHETAEAVARDRRRQNALVGRVTLLRFDSRAAWNGSAGIEVADRLRQLGWRAGAGCLRGPLRLPAVGA